VRVIGTTITGAYVTVILAALILGPLVLMHGYRVWWVVTVYAVLAVGSIGGIASHYLGGPRNRTTRPRHGPPPTSPPGDLSTTD
jgi:hypothetical protein